MAVKSSAFTAPRGAPFANLFCDLINSFISSDVLVAFNPMNGNIKSPDCLSEERTNAKNELSVCFWRFR